MASNKLETGLARASVPVFIQSIRKERALLLSLFMVDPMDDMVNKIAEEARELKKALEPHADDPFDLTFVPRNLE